MWKKILIIGGAFLLLIGLLAAASAFQRSKSRRALDAYIAQLRERGEPLSYNELGLGEPAQTNTSIAAFMTAVGQLGRCRPQPGQLALMQFTGPGIAQPSWKAPMPLIRVSAPGTGMSGSWEEFTGDLDSASDALAALRTSLAAPPTHSLLNPTNPWVAGVAGAFLQKRNAAQWLSADCLAGLHQQDHQRVCADLHALTQLLQMHRDSPTLVNAMIRVAITGLGLNVTWEALQSPTWTEDTLRNLQEDWEQIDLIGALERGIVGERAGILLIFQDPDQMARIQTSTRTTTGTTDVGLADLRDTVLTGLSTAYWRSHIEEDQLLYLRLNQERLDLLRQLKTNAPGADVVAGLQVSYQSTPQGLGGFWSQYRHLLTSVAMPNYSRATEVMLQNETQRRLAIAAIALHRHHLEFGRYPPTLQALVPRFVSAVPADPMNGLPFHYHTNADGGFSLYSVGENGTDDGGISGSGLWAGPDAVWPKAVEAEPPPRELRTP